MKLAVGIGTRSLLTMFTYNDLGTVKNAKDAFGLLKDDYFIVIILTMCYHRLKFRRSFQKTTCTLVFFSWNIRAPKQYLHNEDFAQLFYPFVNLHKEALKQVFRLNIMSLHGLFFINWATIWCLKKIYEHRKMLSGKIGAIYTSFTYSLHACLFWPTTRWHLHFVYKLPRIVSMLSPSYWIIVEFCITKLTDFRESVAAWEPTCNLSASDIDWRRTYGPTNRFCPDIRTGLRGPENIR